MQKRKLGKSGLEVSALGLGCMGMTFSYGPPADKQEMISLIHAAVERGVTFFDTAEVYGPFNNEELVGEALAPFKGKVVIATKFGFELDPEGGSSGRPEQPAGAHQAGRRRLAQAAQGRRHRSLLSAPRRPGRADRGRGGRGQGTDPGRQGQALRPLRSRARKRSVARTPSSRSRRCRASTRCGTRTPEKEVLPTLEELGIGFVPYSPLGKGFLTGSINENTKFDSSDFRSILPRFTPEALKANQALIDLLGRIAARKEGDARPDRARLASGPEAVDRADSGHHQASATGGEHRSRLDRADGRRSPRDRKRRLKNHGARRSLPRKTGATDRPLNGRPGRPAGSDPLPPAPRAPGGTRASRVEPPGRLQLWLPPFPSPN